MPSFTSPEVVVQRQLDAYNAKDLDAWLSTYAEDAKQFELGGGLLAHGHEAIRARTAQRFKEPNLHALLLKRVVMGKVVIDNEDVVRTFSRRAGKRRTGLRLCRTARKDSKRHLQHGSSGSHGCAFGHRGLVEKTVSGTILLGVFNWRVKLELTKSRQRPIN